VDAAARKGVDLQVDSFEQSTHTAVEAAQAVGAEVGQIVKSLVFVALREAGSKAFLALVSGANTVDLDLLAAVLGEPRIRRATADEARRLTGFVIGGIPPFGHPQPLQTPMDRDLGRFETVWAAAGAPNAVFAVAPGVLRVLADATVADICRQPDAAPANASSESAASARASAGATDR